MIEAFPAKYDTTPSTRPYILLVSLQNHIYCAETKRNKLY